MTKDSDTDQPAGRTRPPGRPNRDLELRARLLEAARAEFAAHGFRGASIQAIARAAGATPAMVHYYFGNKGGLYRAMLEHTLGPVLEKLQSEVARADATDDPIAAFVGAYMHQLAARPEIPALLLRDVLSPDAQMRDEFVERFAMRGGGIIKSLIRSGIEEGRLRADLDPDRAALSLLSMSAFPFLAAPVVERVFGQRRDRRSIEQLAAHTLAMFYRGAGAAHPES